MVASLVYNLGAGLTAPLFNRNELMVQWNNAQSNQRIALNNCHQTILKAYQEVIGLMVENQFTTDHLHLQSREVEINRNSIASANELFRLQFIGYLEVLAADEEFFNSRISHTELTIYRYIIQYNLYRALGGGVF